MAEQAAMWFAGCALILWTPAAFAGVLLLGIVYARNLEFVHECLHAIAVPRPRHNAILGHLLALPMLVSFERWRTEHMLHHRDVQVEGFQYEYARLTTWREYVIHVLMLRHFVDALACVCKLDRRYRFVTLAIFAIAALAVVTHSWLPIVLWIMPLPIAAIVHTHIELPEHFGLDGVGSTDPMQNSRVIPATRFVTWFVNANNYHAIHHWKPSLPISKLREAFATVRDVEISSYRSFYRRFFAGLALLAALAVMVVPARAEDFGPKRDIAAIRHDLPIVDARYGQIAVDGVVVDGNDAAAQTHVDGATYIELLRRRYDRWWLEGRWTAGSCFNQKFLDSPIRSLAVAHLSEASKLTNRHLCDPAPLLFHSHDAWYQMALQLASNDAGIAHFDIDGRSPTEAESWMAHGGDAYFFFYANVKSDAPIHVQSGTTIDVWFPFALEPAKKYSLTIGHTDAPIGPVDGTLKDNTLHFVLPAFSLTPGAHLMGEIDGD